MSSMYNDASLALIPSAVGDGVVYNARPVEVLGAELVTNGDFATDSDWTKEAAWTISNSVASVKLIDDGVMQLAPIIGLSARVVN